MTLRAPAGILLAFLIVPPAARGQASDAAGFVLGAPDAPVTVTEFADFGCSACAAFATATFPALRREFIETGRVRWELVPVTLGFRHSKRALTAALCAHEQGAFWPMHDLLFARQSTWQEARDPSPAFLDLARATGLDTTAFIACSNSGHLGDRIKRLTRRGQRHGLRGTPGFLVGDQWVYGAQPAEVFRQALTTGATQP